MITKKEIEIENKATEIVIKYNKERGCELRLGDLVDITKWLIRQGKIKVNP